MLQALITHYPALAYPRFRRYWFASFASVGATQLITLGQGWLVFELSNSPLQLGWLGAAAAGPNIIMTLAGGVIADRFNQRLILMFTSGSIALLLLLQAWLSASGLAQVWHVLAIAAAISLVTGLDWPARAAIYPRFIGREAMLSAVALNAFIWQSTRMAIPALGGLMIGLWDTWTVFAAGSAGFLVMFAVMLTLRIPTVAAPRASPWQQLSDGIRFIRRTDLFRWLLTITFIGMFFANSYIQLMPVFADLLEAGEQGYGYLLSAGGVGAVLGAVLVGGIHRFQRLGLLMLGAAAASIVSLFAFAWSADQGNWPATLFLAFLIAVFTSGYMIISMTVLQLKVPDALRGRVMGIHTIGYSLIPLGGLFLGALAEQMNAASAVMIGGGIYLTVLCWHAFSKRPLRTLDGTRLNAAISPDG